MRRREREGGSRVNRGTFVRRFGITAGSPIAQSRRDARRAWPARDRAGRACFASLERAVASTSDPEKYAPSGTLGATRVVGGARLSTSTALAVTAARCAFLGFIAATLGATPTNEEVRADISESRLEYASV